MTIEGKTYEGWPIHPDYRPNAPDGPAPLRHTERQIDLPGALELWRQHRTRNVFRRIMEKLGG